MALIAKLLTCFVQVFFLSINFGKLNKVVGMLEKLEEQIKDFANFVG